MSAGAELLRVDGVCKSFGGVEASRSVDLTVREGEIVGLIGPNGSGKSTLFNLVTGTLPVDSGSIRLGGTETTGLTTEEIARLGLVRTYQTTRVFRQMTCLGNMLVSRQASPGLRGMLSRPGARDRAEASEYLDYVGLAARRDVPAGDLSFGQQKLLELAMALLARPRLLLLDEPTAGINPTLINGVVARLKGINREMGVSLLVIEHNMGVIMGLAGRIYCLAHGTMLFEGTPGETQRSERVIDAYLGGG